MRPFGNFSLPGIVIVTECRDTRNLDSPAGARWGAALRSEIGDAPTHLHMHTTKERGTTVTTSTTIGGKGEERAPTGGQRGCRFRILALQKGRGERCRRDSAV